MNISYKLPSILSLIFICAAYTEATPKRDSGKKEMTYKDSIISIKYSRGRNLIFDCIDKHWVCTGNIEKNRCNKLRKNRIKDYGQNLGCAFIKSYDHETDCHLDQQKLTNKGHYSSFCNHKSYKLKGN